MVAAFTRERSRRASRPAALRNPAARRSKPHADQSRHASRAAATAARTSVGPAWCTLARTWRWQWGITASVVFPVRTSLPPITSGISMGRADRSFRARLSSARWGVPGAWERTGSLTGTGIFGMVFIARNLTALWAVSLRQWATAIALMTSIDPRVHIGHVHLTVSDLERALAFYRDVLGFEVTTRYGGEAVFLSAGGYHHHIGLNTWAGRGAPRPPAGTTRLYHFAILYPDRQALGAAVRRGLGPGIPLEGASDHGVSEAVYLRG